MSFRLDLNRPVPDAVRAVAHERLQRVIGQLSGDGDADSGKAIHEARKDLKRLRSLVRLLRPGLSEKRYRREADALREVSRSLGARREAVALVEAVDALHEHAAGQVPAATFEGLREALLARASAVNAEEDTEAELEALRAIEGRIDAGKLDVADRETLVAGLVRSYTRGTETRATAEADPTGELLHEWRKRVKDLWYQQALIGDAWPAVLDAQAEQAKDLSQLLGDDHDLWELDALLRDPEGPAAQVPADTDALLPLVADRRAELQAAARAAGARVYAESPKAFGRRIRAYLTAPPVAG
ncbi:CHAD domain-containing protein [Patulibacter americanus]|uniref:CHAD domain-containing protein n=1 Tax=Patulibacter americanus TaxID=588672 RepID=UPI0003B3AACB|nr:CHAD domain-containing protein [Patulibacter americanus]